jgi:hypothetical protein
MITAWQQYSVAWQQSGPEGDARALSRSDSFAGLEAPGARKRGTTLRPRRFGQWAIAPARERRGYEPPPVNSCGKVDWRPRPELNRSTRFCRPLRNHSATWPWLNPVSETFRTCPPGARWRPAIQERVMAGNRSSPGTSCGPGRPLASLGGEWPFLRRTGNTGIEPGIESAEPENAPLSAAATRAWRNACILRPLAAKRRRQHSPGTRR